MKLKTMEDALEVYQNRFELTMMAVARAREINDGDTPLVQMDELNKPVVTALAEIAEGKIIPATQQEMSKMGEAKRILRERALMEARQAEDLLEIAGGSETFSGVLTDEGQQE
jgi:DNA-directed RNA polymerase subunit omega